MGDEASYLTKSLFFHDALAAGELSKAVQTYLKNMDHKAPLISVLPVPFYALFDRSHDSALCVNVALSLPLCFYTFKLAERAFGRPAAALSLLVLNTLPMLYGLGRLFFVEYGLAALVAAWVYHLVASEGFTRPGHTLALGVYLGLGLLMKALFPLYIAGPLAACLLHWRREGRAPGQMARALAPGLAAALLLAATWYPFQWKPALSFMLSAGYGEIAADYGSRRVFAPGVIWGYLQDASRNAVSHYYGWGLILLPLLLLYPASAARRRLRQAMDDAGLSSLLAWLIFPTLVLTFGVNKDLRFTAPVLPAIAILLSGALARLASRRRWAWPLIGLYLSLPLNLYLRNTFGWSFLKAHAVDNWLVAPLREGRRPAALRQLLTALEPLQEGAAQPMQAIVLANSSVSRNLIYYDVLENRKNRFHLVQRARSADDIRRQIEARRITHILAFPEETEDRFMLAKNKILRDLLSDGKVPFHPEGEILLPSWPKIRVYARREPAREGRLSASRATKR